MNRRKDSGRNRPTERTIDIVECPKCGCPNRPTDTVCMYCRAELSRANTGLGKVVSYYLGYVYYVVGSTALRLTRGASGRTAGMLLTLFVAFAMAVGGTYFLVAALAHGGLFNWSVGALLLLYGITALANVFSAIRGR